MNAKATDEKVLVQLWTTPTLKAAVEADAARNGLSLAAFLRRMLTRKYGA